MSPVFCPVFFNLGCVQCSVSPIFCSLWGVSSINLDLASLRFTYLHLARLPPYKDTLPYKESLSPPYNIHLPLSPGPLLHLPWSLGPLIHLPLSPGPLVPWYTSRGPLVPWYASPCPLVPWYTSPCPLVPCYTSPGPLVS